ncbi:uncharacterized protein LY79DRAFT_536296 [Colletotrichum navitas]|uniref:Uncharacterized protein n=1 Tax=Colletotrichum navitas TaxID=681940 RepID=A0AAD8QA76_9PEZI|nr:uncharacterized protein LY79DRAFT_536296 [Colletotrichum navitas]KAK1598876.1 hypothetical protein LY79DRAFT_536296 [Colletotrichum navitas]
MLVSNISASSLAASALASMVIFFCSRGVRTLPPPRGNRGSSSLSKAETAGALGAGASAVAVFFSFVGVSRFDGRDTLEAFAALDGGVPPGASFRLSELIFVVAPKNEVAIACNSSGLDVMEEQVQEKRPRDLFAPAPPKHFFSSVGRDVER